MNTAKDFIAGICYSSVLAFVGLGTMLRKKEDLRYALTSHFKTNPCIVDNSIEDIISDYIENVSLAAEEEIVEKAREEEDIVDDAVETFNITSEKEKTEHVEENHAISTPLELLKPEFIENIVKSWESQQAFKNVQKYDKFVVINKVDGLKEPKGVYKLRQDFSQEVEKYLRDLTDKTETIISEEKDFNWKKDVHRYLNRTFLKKVKENECEVESKHTLGQDSLKISDPQTVYKQDKNHEVTPKPPQKRLQSWYHKLKGKGKEKGKQEESTSSCGGQQQGKQSKIEVRQQNQLPKKTNLGNGGGAYDPKKQKKRTLTADIILHSESEEEEEEDDKQQRGNKL
jgi:hypothetical protein